MSCFDTAPEFIDEDNRRFRHWNPVSRDQMFAKHEALLPPELLTGKTVADLGACLGATGHWCLSHGAKHYTGVEVQEGYTALAQRLLGRYHKGKFSIDRKTIEEWLEARSEQFDIVCMLGVIYGFTDYYSILEQVAGLARETVVIEGLYPNGAEQREEFCGVQFVDEQPMNLATEPASVLGRGTRVSPKGLQWLMAEFGFASLEGILRPRPTRDVPDIYNRSLGSKLPVRYLMRFQRGGAQLKSVSMDLQQGSGRRKPWQV